MSRQDLIDPSDRLLLPARRQALFTARDMMLATFASPALAALASPAAAAAAASSLHVVHGFADLQGITLWFQGAAAQSLRVEVRSGEGSGAALQTLRVDLDARSD